MGEASLLNVSEGPELQFLLLIDGKIVAGHGFLGVEAGAHTLSMASIATAARALAGRPTHVPWRPTHVPWRPTHVPWRPTHVPTGISNRKLVALKRTPLCAGV